MPRHASEERAKAFKNLDGSTKTAPNGQTWWRTVRGTDWGNECIIERYY